MRVDGHAVLHAVSAPRSPSVMSTLGAGKQGEQRHVDGLRLMLAPLEAQHLAGLAVDGDDRTPVVAHAHAVRHHHVMPDCDRRDLGWRFRYHDVRLQNIRASVLISDYLWLC